MTNNQHSHNKIKEAFHYVSINSNYFSFRCTSQCLHHFPSLLWFHIFSYVTRGHHIGVCKTHMATPQPRTVTTMPALNGKARSYPRTTTIYRWSMPPVIKPAGLPIQWSHDKQPTWYLIDKGSFPFIKHNTQLSNKEIISISSHII